MEDPPGLLVPDVVQVTARRADLVQLDCGTSGISPFCLAVIGGGFPGTAAALEPSRRDSQVAIWAGDGFPWHEVCGEFIPAESLPFLQQGISSALGRGSVIRRAEFVAQSGRRYSFTLPSAARGLSLFVMDEALWPAGICSGADGQTVGPSCRLPPCCAFAGSRPGRTPQVCYHTSFGLGREAGGQHALAWRRRCRSIQRLN